jgi:hypothetical protein
VRQLEVVAVSDDGTYVLLAGDENAARATHAVRIDNRLQAAIRGELDDSDERRESELSPRDIQARLRAGESTEAVAKAARVPVARVMRYAGPVLSERDRIVGQAQAAVLQRARGPELSTPLGEVVERRLAETVGLRTETVEWTARRRDDGAWIVELAYSARGGARRASWLWQPAERELASLNSLATRLGADDPPRRPGRRAAVKRAAPKPAKRPAAKRPAAKQPAKAKPARKAAIKKAVKRAAPKPAAKKAAVKKAAVKKATVRKPAAKPIAKKSASKPVTKRAASAKAATKKAATRKSVPKPAPARRVRPEPRLIEPQVKRGPNGRIEIPSWSDVLLGVSAPAPARGRRRS